MKLTTEQIQEVQSALAATRVVHYDILVEITDHVASVLEKQQGDFKENLNCYIQDNKTELKKLNRKFKHIGAAKGLRQLWTSFFSIKTLLIFLILVCIYKFMQQLAAPEDRGVFMVLIFEVCMGVACYPAIKNIIQKERYFSFSSGIGLLPSVLLYPSILMPKWIPNPEFLIVYYAFMGTFLININFTTKALYNKYKQMYYA